MTNIQIFFLILQFILLVITKFIVMNEKSKLSDFIDRITSWKTTILGLVSGVVIILVATGVIGKEESEQVSPIVDSIWGSVIMILGGINSLVLLFSKDGEVG